MTILGGYTVIGITGTRQGASADQLVRLEEQLQALYDQGARVFRHGGCIGVDGQAHHIARRLGYHIIGHPCDLLDMQDQEALADCDTLLPAKAPLERNRDIVNAVGYLLVVPKERQEQKRSGTWATYRYAKQVGRRGMIIAPKEETLRGKQ